MPADNEIREKITSQIIEMLECGDVPVWRQPWHADPGAGFPCNAASNRPYSGVNPLVLQAAARRHGFRSRYWATYRQWESLGGRVRGRPAGVPAGQWGTAVCFCKPVTKKGVGDDGEEPEDTFVTLRQFHVFNLDQVEGPFGHLRAGSAALSSGEAEQQCERAEGVIEATRAEVRYGGCRAVYDRAGDYVRVPHRRQFHRPEFYETIFHELCHWAEHPTRLNWDRTKVGNTYALGELIAELGGVYLAGELGLPVGDTLAYHAAYLKSWLAGMRNDTRFIFRAAAQATRAADYILSFSRVQEPVAAETPD